MANGLKMLEFSEGPIFVSRDGNLIRLHVEYAIQNLTVKETKELIAALKDAILDRIK